MTAVFFSLVVGTNLGLSRVRIKRLLAYSTISHIGFILPVLIVHTLDFYKAFTFYKIMKTIIKYYYFLTDN